MDGLLGPISKDSSEEGGGYGEKKHSLAEFLCNANET